MNTKLSTRDFQNMVSANNILLPQKSYSSGKYDSRKVKVFYISDIHLLHHIDESKDVNKQIDDIVKHLFDKELIDSIYKSRLEDFCVFFGGDVSSDSGIAQLFYHKFRIRAQYFYYKNWKRNNSFRKPITSKEARAELAGFIQFNEAQKEDAIKRLSKWFKYTKKHEKMSLYDLIALLRKNKKYPQFLEYYISEIKKREQIISRYSGKDGDEYVDSLEKGNSFVKKKFKFFAVLGNHELGDFSSVEEAETYYSNMLANEQIFLLNNRGYLFENYMIIGGIGFAKYNHKYNVETVCNTNPPMSRENEIAETDKFVTLYKKAIKKCAENSKLLIVLTHYPINDWLEHEYINSRCVYFTGHNHRNTRISSENINIYADNQIGYKRKTISLKCCELGYLYNPFIDYADGCYEITPEQYHRFCDYSGDYIRSTYMIDLQLKTGNANFYMIKHFGFYGFFIVNKKNGTLICSGGATKIISKIKNIDYFNDCFVAVVSKYIQILYPYQNRLKQISDEVKSLGLDGTIHGAIVDVDFSNHIMLNPQSGEITYYYSPDFGSVVVFDDLRQMLEMRGKSLGESNAIELYQYAEEGNYLITKSNAGLSKYTGEIEKVDVKNSPYAMSREICKLQRIFSSNVLREWNDDWAKNCVDDIGKYLPNKRLTEKNKNNS